MLYSVHADGNGDIAMNTILTPLTLDDWRNALGSRVNFVKPHELRGACPADDCGGSKAANKFVVRIGAHGEPYAKCWACGIKTAAARRILWPNWEPGSDYRPPAPAYEPPPEPYPGNVGPADRAPFLPPLRTADAAGYIEDISTYGETGVVEYQNVQGERAWHQRWFTEDGGKKNFNWRLKGKGWDFRKWGPDDDKLKPGSPSASTEGEKDSAVVCVEGYVSFSAPGGAGRIGSLVADAILQDRYTIENGHVIIQDNDGPGDDWAKTQRQILTAQGLRPYRHVPIDLPAKKCLADYPRQLAEIMAYARRHFEAAKARRGGVANCCYSKSKTISGGGEGGKQQFATPPDFRIERGPRPQDLRCTEGKYRKGKSAADATGQGSIDFSHPVDCHKCANCLEWWLIGHWERWNAIDPMAGQATIVEYHGVNAYTDARDLLKAAYQRKGCKGSPAFRATVLGRPHRGPDGVTQRNLTVVLIYPHGLPENGVANSKAWAVDAGYECKVRQKATVTRAYFNDILIRKTVRGEDGKSKRLVGFWHWAPGYRRTESAYGMVGGVTVSDDTGSKRAKKPVGSPAAIERYELGQKDPERAAALNARDWCEYWLTCRVEEGLPQPTVADWEDVLEKVRKRERLEIPGYYGPIMLIKDAAMSWMGKKDLRTAYFYVWRQFGLRG